MLTLPQTSLAQVPPNFFVDIFFDENCHGNFINSAGTNFALPCSLQNDPGPGGLNNVPFFAISNPPGLIAGDLLITEPGTTMLSDILRFNPTLQGGGIFVYSDFELGEARELADVGFPTALSTNLLTVTEVGSEFSNGFVYVPLPGQPGNVSGVPQTLVTYHFFSDTPEPGTIALLVGGCAALLWRRRRLA
jgi:hypothetical protein